jgi:hypothetical protein
MPFALRMRSVFVILLLCFLPGVPVFAQMETATLSGVINDPNGGVVPDVEVIATRIETGTVVTTKTNGAGIYFFTGLVPGHYHLMVRKPGFKEIAIKEFQLYVQDKLEQNFSLEIGSVSETVTVTASGLNINTTDASVSTVVDRQFAENLPMNGRSFQTLIQLTPGVVLTASSSFDGGQFSVNGQRPSSNYWMVDGVGANIGVRPSFPAGNGFGGALGSFSAQGGTNSLVSIDAMQEFRIQTSTYAPEFGRTPGGQISIATRSGTNQFHGTAFDYLRNDLFDANDWFADKAGLPKPEERQNDFGATFGGPILKDRTFFFFSYEGLRLRLPQTALTTVPDLVARQNATLAMQPFLNAFPLPNPGAADVGSGIAPFNVSYSDSSILDAYSLRMDHRLTKSLILFGRYSYSPSKLLQRGQGFLTLNTIDPSSIKTQTATVGATWMISPEIAADLRFNYSTTKANSSFVMDNFGGAIPLTSLPFPAPFTSKNALLAFRIPALTPGGYDVGGNVQNSQSQINTVDNLSMQRGSHALKFGVDFRRLSPASSPRAYAQVAFFSDVPSAETGTLLFSVLQTSRSAELLLNNLGVFGQDTWRVTPRLTLTYGLRWDLDFAPSAINGPALPAVTGFNLNDLSQLALAPAGTPAFRTTYDNVAPRLGIAYHLRQAQDSQTVLRGGFGIFYDLASSEVGNNISITGFPYFGTAFNPGGTFPLPAGSDTPPLISPAQLPNDTLAAFDPNLKLPYTLEWNLALEQGLGSQQTVSASYIGSSGRRLLQSAFISSPNPNIGSADLVSNTAASTYNALQVQFRRRLSRGIQALASYTWSHSIDDGSAGSFAEGSNTFVPGLGANVNRGPSDFDIRNAFSIGVTYELPAPRLNRFTKALLRGWSLENVIQARSAPPVDVFDNTFSALFNGATNIRPDVVLGQPFYLYGPQYPGGKAFNRAAFVDPPLDTNGNPIRQGNLGRNAFRAFGATQWDFAVHRDFAVHEQLRLQFRAEMFNVLNHPNFGFPVGDISNPQFGQSIKMLGRSLEGGQNAGGGAFSSLYQIGGPRSIQFALKLTF